jgi:hypothetical protein
MHTLKRRSRCVGKENIDMQIVGTLSGKKKKSATKYLAYKDSVRKV